MWRLVMPADWSASARLRRRELLYDRFNDAIVYVIYHTFILYLSDIALYYLII